MGADKTIFLAASMLVLALGADADTVNALAPYDNTQNTAFWNTTERTDGVTASAQSSATVTLAGTGGSAGALAATFDSRAGTSVESAPRSLRTNKAKGFLLNFR